ncbi:rhodanese-like domain-containing protein [Ornithinimicrobium flavum]|uniref:rhodanese-like domain-containing protein n=1 Tax=Ornithinimicrobium flavum TaxID=1288636 RepID=UPI001EE7E13A|nr:rhodanese-like domain-containing protein [Ornithinimicrobium flavum]
MIRDSSPQTSMARRRGLLVTVPAMAFVLAGCGGGASNTTDRVTLGAPAVEATALPANGATLGVEDFAASVTVPGTVVLDVRTAAEFATGHLEGAQNLDVSSPAFPAALEQLDRDASYAVYCRSGNRSAAALQLMLGEGFTSVYHLDGGIGAWTATGRPTVT